MKLLNIQKNNYPKSIALRKYVKTRWLSLGQSLTRILDIWNLLTDYMEQNDYAHCAEFLPLFKDKHFKLQIVFLSGIVEKINKSNQIYQSQCLEINNLKSEMINCIKCIARLTIKDEDLSNDPHLLKKKNGTHQLSKTNIV